MKAVLKREQKIVMFRFVLGDDVFIICLIEFLGIRLILSHISHLHHDKEQYLGGFTLYVQMVLYF